MRGLERKNKTIEQHSIGTDFEGISFNQPLISTFFVMIQKNIWGMLNRLRQLLSFLQSFPKERNLTLQVQ